VRLVVIAAKIDSQEAYGHMTLGTNPGTQLGMREKEIFEDFRSTDFKLIESYMPVLAYHKQTVMED
jgi:hypothetical protein